MGRARLPGSSRSELAPGFIVAMPQLADPNFRRTVVFLLRSTEHGSVGLVINRPTNLSVRELCESQGIDYRGDAKLPMMIGGPVEVEQHLLVLHGETPCLERNSDDEVEIVRGIRLVTAVEGLRILAERGSRRFRCYAGYAGWAPGQLESELEEGAWIPLGCDDSLVFDGDFDRVWELAIRRGGIDPFTLVPGGGGRA